MLKKITLTLYFLSIISIIIVASCKAEEFIYPVAQIDDENLFIIHQRSLDDLSLFVWNRKTNLARKELSSIFFPSHVAMLPEGTGFSFLDRGRIRIKLFQKRAPRAIDILDPVDSITTMRWINSQQFYIAGRSLQHHQVFLCDISTGSPTLFRLTDTDSLDYMYPCKIDDSLFYVAKNKDGSHVIAEEPWLPTLYELPRHHRCSDTSLYRSQHPICFLHMISKKEGYFLECVGPEPYDQNLLQFTCYQYKKVTEDSCTTTPLFSFRIPLQYIIGESEHRLYESIHPFLPNYNDTQNILYTDFDRDSKSFNAFAYNKSSCKSLPVVIQKRKEEEIGHLAPFPLHDFVCCGLIIPSEHNHARSIVNMDQDTGEFHLHLQIVPK